jgi:hypothetical protein
MQPEKDQKPAKIRVFLVRKVVLPWFLGGRVAREGVRTHVLGQSFVGENTSSGEKIQPVPDWGVNGHRSGRARIAKLAMIHAITYDMEGL